jgi:hypothetical protein
MSKVTYGFKKDQNVESLKMTFNVMIFDVLFGHLWTFDVLFLTFDEVIFDVLTLSPFTEAFVHLKKIRYKTF